MYAWLNKIHTNKEEFLITVRICRNTYSLICLNIRFNYKIAVMAVDIKYLIFSSHLQHTFFNCLNHCQFLSSSISLRSIWFPPNRLISCLIWASSDSRMSLVYWNDPAACKSVTQYFFTSMSVVRWRRMFRIFVSFGSDLETTEKKKKWNPRTKKYI